MFRKIISLMLIAALVLSFTTAATAASTTTPTTQEQKANVLKDLGLFAGTNNGFELDRAPTRTEAIVLLLRMLGVAQEAINSTYTHTFKDVPAWADKYIAYAYNKGLTGGYSKTAFGGNDAATPEQFCALTLRALQYTEKDGDFVYKESIKKAEEMGLAVAGKYKAGAKNFTRGDCVDIIYKALSVVKKTEGVTLAESLVKKGVIDAAKAESYGLYSAYQKIRIPLRPEPENGKLAIYVADVIKQVPGAKYGNTLWNGNIGLTDYEQAAKIFITGNYDSITNPNKPADLAEYLTNDYNIPSNYAFLGSNARLMVGIFDEKANLLAISICVAKDAASAGYMDFVLVNVKAADLIAEIDKTFNELFGNPVEAPNAITTIEKAKVHWAIIDNKTGKVKEEGTSSNYDYHLVIDKTKYPELAGKAVGITDISAPSGLTALDAITRYYKGKISELDFSGKFVGACEINEFTMYTNQWTQNAYEWNNPRYVIFDDGTKPIAYTTIYPSQLKVVDVGTVKLEVYKDYTTNTIVKRVYIKE